MKYFRFAKLNVFRRRHDLKVNMIKSRGISAFYH